jgi:hypothetical protein
MLLFQYLLFPVALAFAEYNAVKLSHDPSVKIRAAPSRTVEEIYLAIGRRIAAAGLHNRAADNASAKAVTSSQNWNGLLFSK